ncbi:Transcription initiation factor TFIID subunit 3 [Orchesella cincta]|uniref:Transcription initiation factor TFIID subunit 3 n=1 Tax=Orchesella cincta TaxID=48709 RepID=A0A1D2M5V5_ORCCI|nr:Transcription initiation factor TFIID subunit 3 [Orchesella cincta]
MSRVSGMRRIKTDCTFCTMALRLRWENSGEEIIRGKAIKALCNYQSFNIQIPSVCSMELIPFCDQCETLVRQLSSSLEAGNDMKAERLYRTIELVVVDGEILRLDARYRQTQDDLRGRKWTGLTDEILEGYRQKVSVKQQRNISGLEYLNGVGDEAENMNDNLGNIVITNVRTLGQGSPKGKSGAPTKNARSNSLRNEQPVASTSKPAGRKVSATCTSTIEGSPAKFESYITVTQGAGFELPDRSPKSIINCSTGFQPPGASKRTGPVHAIAKKRCTASTLNKPKKRCATSILTSRDYTEIIESVVLGSQPKAPTALGMNPEEIKKEKVEVDSCSEESCDGFGTAIGTMTQPESKTTSNVIPSGSEGVPATEPANLTFYGPGPVNTWRKQVAAVTPPMTSTSERATTVENAFVRSDPNTLMIKIENSLIKSEPMEKKKIKKESNTRVLENMRKYVPTMPGISYCIPLSEAVTMGTFTLGGVQIWICPVCQKEENEDISGDMVCCEVCQDWFHWSCVGITKDLPRDHPWYCQRCLFDYSDNPCADFPNVFPE